jgi:hypothetical protein
MIPLATIDFVRHSLQCSTAGILSFRNGCLDLYASAVVVSARGAVFAPNTSSNLVVP